MKITTKRKSLSDCHLYGILDWSYLNRRDPIEVALKMLDGGIDIIQIRAKDFPAGEISRSAKQIISLTKSYGVPLIINDDPELAAEIDAEGVHVGQDDLGVSEARKILGPNKWVGKSTHSVEQARSALNEGADYIGVGPIYATPTKPTYCPVGLELIEHVKKFISIPFFCIGGIKLENAHEIIERGASRFVVVSGILQAPNILEYCQNLRKMLP
jgi:thiamine-phosphate pyrophosphorylase